MDEPFGFILFIGMLALFAAPVTATMLLERLLRRRSRAQAAAGSVNAAEADAALLRKLTAALTKRQNEDRDGRAR